MMSMFQGLTGSVRSIQAPWPVLRSPGSARPKDDFWSRSPTGTRFADAFTSTLPVTRWRQQWKEWNWKNRL